MQWVRRPADRVYCAENRLWRRDLEPDHSECPAFECGHDAVEDVVFAETSSIGVRWQEVRRTVADRSIVPVATEWGSVGVKVAERNGQVINVAPEFGDCRALADQTGAPLKKIYQAAMNAWSLLKR